MQIDKIPSRMYGGELAGSILEIDGTAGETGQDQATLGRSRMRLDKFIAARKRAYPQRQCFDFCTFRFGNHVMEFEGF